MEDEPNKESKESIQTTGSSCEPCNENNRQSLSAFYCKECDEYLCEDCKQNHKTTKATKQHEPITVSETIKLFTKPCEPCETRKVFEPAANYCEECEEYLCTGCTNNHKLGKATKAHVPVKFKFKLHGASKSSDDNPQLCEPCAADKKSQSAVRFCEICEELLCEQCLNTHLISKATKTHVPVPVESMNQIKTTSSTTDLCEICTGIKKESPATMFCEECDEILCDRCVEKHRIQKITKNHKTKPLSERKRSVQICDICQDESFIAIKFCDNCEELLCEKCTQQHTKQKATKAHVLGPVPQKQDEPCIMCSPCSASEESNKSTNYCKECNEFLCDSCSGRHRIQKSTKMHELCRTQVALKDFPKCELCLSDGKSSLAEKYCKECQEVLCGNCKDIHKKQKATRTHQLISVKDRPETEGDFPDRTRENVGIQRDEQTENAAKERPGKPVASPSDIKADSIRLSWDRPEKFNEGDYYQVSYRDVDSKGKWKIWTEECTRATSDITNMKSNTKFVFRVRVVFSHGNEGPYSEESDEYCTINSPASRIVSFAKKLGEDVTSPVKYALPITELRNARNEKAKTKKFEIGTPPGYVDHERTIMLVGATGTGKSTLVDGLVNYTLGVNWIDSFRFTVLDLEEEEKERVKNQALSQTEWITCYTINPEHGSRLRYRLNIIDTPGFGDTRGLQRDQEIVEQIRQLFSDTGPKGISCIDAVCFLIKAPDARLTAVQTYIFQSVMSLFGKDIEHNICSLITFADGIDPPVLAALRESKLPFGQHFTFNNSGLFAKNTNISTSSLSPMFWDMGLSSFKAFFSHLETVQTKSLQLTKDVLDERFRLEATIRNLQPQIDVGLTKVDQLKKEIKILDDNKTLIKDNANFEYEVPETQQRKKELPKGMHVTNCTHCHFTCHDNCGLADDKDKAKCVAMDSNGNCKVCPDKCNWTKHANTPYIFEYVDVKVKKTYADMQKKYLEATGKLLSQEQILEQMTTEIDEICEDIEDMMEIVRNCNDRIKETALRPNPLSMTEHIDMMIQAEKLEKKPGFQNRINVLLDFRKRALVLSDAETFSKEARSALGTVGKGARKQGGRDFKSLFNRFKTWISS